MSASGALDLTFGLRTRGECGRFEVPASAAAHTGGVANVKSSPLDQTRVALRDSVRSGSVFAALASRCGSDACVRLHATRGDLRVRPEITSWCVRRGPSWPARYTP